MKCPECKVNYPAEILDRLMVNGSYTAPICGICALRMVNELHGDTREAFDAPIAEEMRQRALRHRNRTGQTHAKHE